MRRRIAVLVAMAVLSACTEKKALPTARRSALADSADQVIFGLRTNLTNEGVNRARLIADTAYFFDDNTRIELDKVHTTFYNTAGIKDAVLTSERGTYTTRLGNMLARKNVVVVSEDGRRLTTQELLYSTGRNEISSDSAFVLTEPNRRLSGIGFRSDPNMTNIRILKGASGFVRDVSTAPPPSPPAPSTATSTPQR